MAIALDTPRTLDAVLRAHSIDAGYQFDRTVVPLHLIDGAVDPISGAHMVERLALRLNDWRVLVNCAAIFRPDDVTALDSATYDRSMAINAKTPIRMTQAFLRLARSRKGRTVIQFTDQNNGVNVSSR